MKILVVAAANAVYEGVKSLNAEDDETNPVNVYGRTKLEAEVAIRANWTNHGVNLANRHD
jgi:dTDP-4-dehydrorhamnose reductase